MPNLVTRGLALAVVASLMSGCVAIHAISPNQPKGYLVPHPTNPGHYLSPIKPELVTHVDAGVFRYLRWEGEETFTSFSIQPFGTAAPGEEKRRCLHLYWGTKIDEIVQAAGETMYSYVYRPREQSAFRWHDCGYPHLMDMGGS